MRNKHLISGWIFLLSLALVYQTSYSQQNNKLYNLLLKSGSVYPDENFNSFINEDRLEEIVSYEGQHYCFIQFYSIPSQTERYLIESTGIELLDFVPYNAYIAAIPKGYDLNLLNSYGIRHISKINPIHKMATNIISAPYSDWAVNADGSVSSVVRFYKNVNALEARTELTRQGYEIKSFDDNTNTISVDIPEGKIFQFAAIPFIMYLEEAPHPPVHDDTEARSLHRVNAVNSAYPAGRHYDGTGVVCAVADDGAIGPHIDYQGRLTQHTIGYGGTHGDMTSGILMGCGNLDPTIVGSAPGAYLQLYSINGYPHIVDAPSNYQTLGTVITSTSYSQSCGGEYTSDASAGDQQIRQNPQLIHVFSAGNAGTQNCGYGAGAGWGNITGGYKAAKNTIACGNLDYLGNLATSSSRGPAADGRIKPDICANGVDQLSTDGPNDYQVGGGTSAAAPSIAGIVATLYQAYRIHNNGQNPETPLLKACLLNTAEDYGNPGPDFSYGWGRVNALRAVKVIEDNRYTDATIEHDSLNMHTINVPAGVKQLRVMLYWLDYEGAPNAAKALVNNLNMLLIDPLFQPFNPWVLDPTPNPVTLNLPAIRGIDSLNNMEQVTIEEPLAGNYTVEVHGYQIPQGPQKYYIVYEFITNEIDVTYPLGGEAFAPGESQALRWDAYGDTDKFSLQYSADSGATWTFIDSVNANQRYYEWTVPNILTGDAIIKVNRGFQSGSSEAVFTIMEVPQNLNVDWACPDTCQMSWDSVAGAIAYEVSWLGSFYMDSVGTTTNTSMKIGGINPVDEFWFSVKALGPSNAVGRRAYAIKKDPGIFNCVIPVDAKISAINPSTTTLQDCQDYSNVSINIDIMNEGTSNLVNVDLFYQVNTSAVITEQYIGTIIPGDTASYTFSVPADFTSAGLYKIKSWLSYAGDGNRYNDTITSRITVIPGTTVITDTLEDMESFTLCSTESDCENTSCILGNGWINVINLQGDDIDWRTNSGETPSNNTGPFVDHTHGNTNGKYIYLEASGDCNFKEAYLVSPCIDLTNNIQPAMEFWYHMYGADMGELHIDVLQGINWDLDVMNPISGNQGNLWKQSVVDLTAYAGQIINIRFRGITGSYYRSDIALDDINIKEQTGTGISGDFLNANINIYPNPGKGLFNLTLENLKQENIEMIITDPQARIVFRKTIKDISDNYKSVLDLTGISSGVYFINIKNENFTQTRRIIIQ